MIVARIRHRLTKKAIQNATAIAALMMNMRGETSHEVSETIRANARQLKRIA